AAAPSSSYGITAVTLTKRWPELLCHPPALWHQTPPLKGKMPAQDILPLYVTDIKLPSTQCCINRFSSG
ncbi:hypothetical protein Nmel_016298, partial [Mimus melanotis]